MDMPRQCLTDPAPAQYPLALADLAGAAMSPLVHVKRAFGWNLGSVVPSDRERGALEAAGVKNPAVQRYAAWRRSLLLVALVPTLFVALLGLLAAWEDGFDEYTF